MIYVEIRHRKLWARLADYCDRKKLKINYNQATMVDFNQSRTKHILSVNI